MAHGPIVMIADDLTGALDSAAPFRAAGFAVRVVLRGDAIPVALGTDPDVLVVNTDTRELEAAAARAHVEMVCSRLSHLSPRLLFKKIDSRLKGPIAAEIDAVLNCFGPRRMLACPAVPDQGRLVRDGAVIGMGVSEPIRILDRVPGAEVLDAEGADDLRRISRMLLAAPDTSLVVGARGLAQGLAEELVEGRSVAAPETPMLGRPLLMAIGSRDPITAAQIQALLDTGFAFDCPAPGGHVGRCLPEAQVLLVRMTDDGAARAPATLAERFAVGIAELVASRRPATLFLTGGDTAQAVLDALGIGLLEIEGEILPGVPICRIPGAEMRIVTKSGGFGDVRAIAGIVAAALRPANDAAARRFGVTA